MMNYLKFIPAVLLLSVGSIALAQEKKENKITVQNLDFLVGTWEIEFEIYDTEKPERGIIIKEKGQQICKYDLELNGTPMFITCVGKVTSDKGRYREFRESIRYSPFTKSFERVGLFSNWPATSSELVLYYPEDRKIELRGELGIQHNRLERYEDIYQFNEDYSTYTRLNVANFSNMPVTVFNTTLKGTGRKVAD